MVVAWLALAVAVLLSLSVGATGISLGSLPRGKTTLLRILSGEIAPSRGEARLDGEPLRAFSAVDLARRRAVVPQASAVAFPFTVREVVMLGVTVPGFSLRDEVTHERVDAALDAVDLMPFADRLYPTLSGGERQRVHVARALCQLAAGSRRRAGRQEPEARSS